MPDLYRAGWDPAEFNPIIRIFQIAGVVLFVCGVVVRFILLFGHRNMAIAFIVVGCCIIVTVVIGCCGVLKDNPLMLNIVRLHYDHLTVTPAKEVMFSTVFVCLSAGLRDAQPNWRRYALYRVPFYTAAALF